MSPKILVSLLLQCEMNPNSMVRRKAQYFLKETVSVGPVCLSVCSCVLEAFKRHSEPK